MDRHNQHLAKFQAAFPHAVSRPGDPRYAQATKIWPKIDTRPAIIVHCADETLVQRALELARDAELPLSVRAGGHDWAGRALCDGVVIDLTPMRAISVSSDTCTAIVGGGARANDLLPFTDALGVATATGAVGSVGFGGLTLGGGYGPLTGRVGLVCDNLMSAQVVLADGRVVEAGPEGDAELLWALKGGGGNFGVVTSLTFALHEVPSVRAGIILYPFEEAHSVLAKLEPLAAAAPDELDLPIVLMSGPDGSPLLAIAPTWSGPREEGEAQIAPLLGLGTVLLADVKDRSYGNSRSIFDMYTVDGLHTAMATRWVSRLHGDATAVLIEQIRRRPSPLCAVLTHAFHGAATRIAPDSAAFGFRQPHTVIEIVAQADPKGESDGSAERAWVNETAAALDQHALPGGYANFLTAEDSERARLSYGPNAERLTRAKRHYDPGNVFASAIPLPA
jgi:FAD/FMN-containing dehydrogenase